MEQFNKMFEGMDMEEMFPSPGAQPDNPSEQDGKKKLKKI